MQLWLIDDDPQIGSDLRLLLPRDIHLSQVIDSRTAVALLRKNSHPPDAIILDLCLPPYLAATEDHEGIALLDLLKAELAPQVPVYVLSSQPRTDYGQACLRHGAESYLEKPCSIRDLVNHLSSVGT